MDKSEEKIEEGVTPDVDEGAEVEDSEGSIDALKGKLAQAQLEIEKNREMALRTKADLENLKRRHSKELEGAHKFALENFSQELLAVRDSLEMGLSAAKEENSELGKLIEGSELTLKQLETAMEKFGVVQIDPVGEKFNPVHHQAISVQEAEGESNTVIAVVQKGYTLNDRLIRPAMVVVSKNSSEANESGKIDEQA